MSASQGPKPNGGMASQAHSKATSGIGEDRPKIFDEQGAIGNQFTEQGALGGVAQKIGGPLDKEGMIGKQFTTAGSIGGSVQDSMGGKAPRSN